MRRRPLQPPTSTPTSSRRAARAVQVSGGGASAKPTSKPEHDDQALLTLYDAYLHNHTATQSPTSIPSWSHRTARAVRHSNVSGQRETNQETGVGRVDATDHMPCWQAAAGGIRGPNTHPTKPPFPNNPHPHSTHLTHQTTPHPPPAPPPLHPLQARSCSGTRPRARRLGRLRALTPRGSRRGTP